MAEHLADTGIVSIKLAWRAWSDVNFKIQSALPGGRLMLGRELPDEHARIERGAGKMPLG